MAKFKPTGIDTGEISGGLAPDTRIRVFYRSCIAYVDGGIANWFNQWAKLAQSHPESICAEEGGDDGASCGGPSSPSLYPG